MNILWVVKSVENEEIYRRFVVRAENEARAIELVKSELVNTVFNEAFSVSATKLLPDGFEEVILVGER